MHKLSQTGIRVVFLYACWLAMMAVHEAGHVLHAWLSGGHVTRVVLPLLGFSRTDVTPNPHPVFVAWGGAIWGNLIPLVLFAVAIASRFRFARWVEFFAGFCLVANGAYLAAGSFGGVGDAGDLMRHGTPQWLLIATGTLSLIGGLFLWHRLGLPTKPTTP